MTFTVPTLVLVLPPLIAICVLWGWMVKKVLDRYALPLIERRFPGVTEEIETVQERIDERHRAEVFERSERFLKMPRREPPEDDALADKREG